jgi:hypothetical protein
MYQDLKQKYWWYGLKRDVAAHVAMQMRKERKVLCK